MKLIHPNGTVVHVEGELAEVLLKRGYAQAEENKPKPKRRTTKR